MPQVVARLVNLSGAQARAWDLWLDCKSEREIGEAVGVPFQTIHDWLSEKRKSAEFGQPPASRQHFDIWQFQTAG